MRAFYDQIVPQFLNQYGKKWGARVVETRIPGAGERTPETSLELRPPRQGLVVPALDITPAMRRSVLREGQALFERRPEYAVREGVSKQEVQALAQEALADLGRELG